MSMNVVSLQDKISRANSYYQELCDHQKKLQQECKTASQDLIKVEKTIGSLCGAILSATKMSHVGASQAIGAMQNSSGLLRIVYELLQSDHSYTSITARKSSASSKMIHYSPKIAGKQKQLAALSETIAALGGKTLEHSESLEKLQSTDIDEYQAKANQMSEEIAALGYFVGKLADYIADAERLYGAAQTNAITRANHIPY